jgi:hypothetical protein
MTNDGMTKERPMTNDAKNEIQADANGMVTVTAAIDGFRDNGKHYRAGDTLHMHKDLVPGALAAKQISLAGMQDKQVIGGVNK